MRVKWVNLGTLGAKGDGVTDDTAAIKDAIAKYRVIYLPTGRYRVPTPSPCSRTPCLSA